MCSGCPEYIFLCACTRTSGPVKISYSGLPYVIGSAISTHKGCSSLYYTSLVGVCFKDNTDR